MEPAEKIGEIKPCPFCGGKAEIEEMYGPTYSVGCTKCTAEIFAIYFSEEDCVEAWNNRYEPPNEPLTLDEMEEMNRKPIWVQFLDPADADKCEWEICKYYMYDWNLYGKMWVAYRRRPGEVME